MGRGRRGRRGRSGLRGRGVPLEELRREPFTYAPVGQSAADLPEKFDHLDRSRVVGRGTADFDRAGAAVMGWQVQRRSGIRVDPSSPEARPGTVLTLRLGLGPVAVVAPARVVLAVEERQRRGFAYGTLPGHPLSGEEAFLLELRDDGDVVFTVRAYSRPGSLLARLAGPLNGRLQWVMAGRYLSAVHRLLREPA